MITWVVKMLDDQINLMQSGYIKIPRMAFDIDISPRKKNMSFPENYAFIYLINSANYLPGSRIIDGKIYFIDRGQYVCSIRYLQKRFNWKGTASVTRFLNKLENMELIETDIETGMKRITICNYDDFQDTPNGFETHKKKLEKTNDTNNKERRK